MFNTIFQQSASCTQQPTVYLTDEEIIDYTRCSDNPSEFTIGFRAFFVTVGEPTHHSVC